MSFFKEVFGFKSLIADVRTAVVSMVTASAVLILGPIATAIWRSVKSQTVPWTILVLITLLGIVLLIFAIVKFLKLPKAEKKNNGFLQPAPQSPPWPDLSEIEWHKRMATSALQAALHRLKIACAPDIEGCVSRVPWGHEVWANFLRVKVESDSSASIKNCTGFLIRIEKDGKIKWGGDNAQLTFAHGKDPDTFAKTIRRKIPEFLDVLAVSSKNEIYPNTKDHIWRYRPSIAEIFSEPGDYVLTVAVTGEDVETKTALLKFTWTQNWETVELRLIPESSVQLAPQLTTSDPHSEMTDTLKRYGSAVVPPSISIQTSKTSIELIDDLISEISAIELFCGDMSDGQEAKGRVDSFIEKARSVLRHTASDYVATFNDAVGQSGTALHPSNRGSRTVIEMAQWAEDRVRQRAWQLASNCLNRLNEIRRKMRARLP